MKTPSSLPTIFIAVCLLFAVRASVLETRQVQEPQTPSDGSETGWQVNKSVLECNQYMLDKQIAPDVSFEVGPPDGATSLVRAHKYVLTSRSPVFEAMFTSNQTDNRTHGDVIRVPDVQVTTFRQMLKFIYYEAADDITPDDIPPLLKVATKYQLPALARKCLQLLEANFTAADVCKALEHSLAFGQQEMKNSCLSSISQNADSVIKTDAFMQLSRDAVLEIVQLDDLRVNEVELFKACVEWAKRKFQQLHPSDEPLLPTDQQIRETLGDVLLKIRFPTMSPTDFAELVGVRDILTSEDKNEVYYYVITKRKRAELSFSTSKRLSREDMTVSRFDAYSRMRNDWYHSGDRDAIDFQTSFDGELVAVGLYGTRDGSKPEVTISVTSTVDRKVLCQMKVILNSTGNSSPIRVTLSNPVEVRSGVRYTISTRQVSSQTFASEGSSTSVVQCANGSVSFLTSSESQNGSGVSSGQIPQLIFWA